MEKEVPMETGRVIKSYNSFFYVQPQDSEELIACKIRGRFKRKQGIYPGDYVLFGELPDKSGIIEKLLPRESLMKRPKIANIDQVVLMFAVHEPELHPQLLNRFLVLAEWSGIPRILICFNKCDLLEKNDTFFQEYTSVGYPILRISVRESRGLDLLMQNLYGHTTLFSGPSGVGKSSLLNALIPGLSLTTGTVSSKIKRGKQTTRVAKLIPLPDGSAAYGKQKGYLVDSPGFSSLNLQDIPENVLPQCFPEFSPFIGHCRFSPCSHSHEPGCAVKKAVEEGRILRERYEAYLSILKEIHMKKKEY
jgi:ribosome biogenesis GTPase